MMMCQQQRTRSLLSAGGPSSFTLFFYSLSLSLCVCVCVCVIYVCIYITTIRVPSFPLRSFPKRRASNTVWREGHHQKSQIRVHELISCVFLSLNLSLGLVLLLLFRRCFLLSFFAFWTVFPQELPQNTKRRQSLVLFLACCCGSFSARTLIARREDRHSSRGEKERERERVFGGRRVFERETRLETR